MHSRCSTHGCLCWADGQNVHCCLCWADGQNVHCCLCGVDGQNVQCIQDAQHTAVFVGLMDRMFTAVFVEWMDRMFNAFKMLNTRLSLLGGWTECSLLSLWSGWTECSMRSRCSTHGCLCWADGQNVQCVQDAQHTAVFVGRMDRMFNTLLSLLGGWTECSLLSLWSGWTECSMRSRCSTHCCLCWADGQNVQHTAVFVGLMDRMFTAVFVEWMDRMFNAFKMLNTRLSLLGGWTECSLLSLWSGWTECSMRSRCSTHGCLCWADGQNVQCVQDAQHTAVFVGLMDRMFNTLLSLLGGWTECSLLSLWSGWTECSMRSRCSTHGCLCWADGQNVHCCLCGVDGQNVQCVQDAQHMAVFVGRMDRMFNAFKMLNTLLSLLG